MHFFGGSPNYGSIMKERVVLENWDATRDKNGLTRMFFLSNNLSYLTRDCSFKLSNEDLISLTNVDDFPTYCFKKNSLKKWEILVNTNFDKFPSLVLDKKKTPFVHLTLDFRLGFLQQFLRIANSRLQFLRWRFQFGEREPRVECKQIQKETCKHKRPHY